MLKIKSWMFPEYYWDENWNVHCVFYTSNGKRHDIKCKWNARVFAYTFRFRNAIWLTNATRE